MENAQKALIMAGSVLMFLIAISVAIYSYNIVMDVNDSILTSSANNDRNAEFFVSNSVDVERYATKAEIIMAIYGMDDIDYEATKIIVGNLEFKKSDFSTINGKNKIEKNVAKINDLKYSVTYDFSNVNQPVIKYNPVAG